MADQDSSDLGARARLEVAFTGEERRGLMQAAAARSAAVAVWNHERAAAGLSPLRIGLGLHYGPVVAGDIGSRRSMAYATVGDTTNVTSRLQSLTRELHTSIVASGALVAAIEREGAET